MGYQIPKILHLYWGKNQPLSFLKYQTVKTFSNLNTDWEIKVWFPVKTGKTNHSTWIEQKQIHKGKDWFPELANLKCELLSFDFENIGFSNDETEVHKSDVLRWSVLHKHGGFWSDFDILYNRPFECSGIPLDVPRVLFKTNSFHPIGFFGSQQNDHIMKLVLSEAREAIRVDKNYQAGGRIALEKVLNSYNENDSFYAKQEVVYPYNYDKIPYIFLSEHLWDKPNTIGCHWFAGSRKANQVENVILTLDVAKIQHKQFFKAII